MKHKNCLEKYCSIYIFTKSKVTECNKWHYIALLTISFKAGIPEQWAGLRLDVQAVWRDWLGLYGQQLVHGVTQYSPPWLKRTGRGHQHWPAWSLACISLLASRPFIYVIVNVIIIISSSSSSRGVVASVSSPNFQRSLSKIVQIRAFFLMRKKESG